MTASILVATPHAAFGELLRVSLVDSGQYQVELVHSASDARARSQQSMFHLAILDAALNDEPFVSLCMDVLKQQPGVRLVVIPPDNNPNHPTLGGLMPHGYLSRPFYHPDLINTVTRLLAERDRQFQAQSLSASTAPLPAARPAVIVPPWLKEPLALRSCLEKEMAKTQAVAAIASINSPGGNAILANTGVLEEKAVQDLVEIVFRYWNHAEKTDLMRFVRLAEEKKDFLIYATPVIGELVLILAYDTASSLSIVRPQTKAMAQSLGSVPPEGYQVEQAAPVDLAPTASGIEQPAPAPAIDWSFDELAEPSQDGPSLVAKSEPETQPLEDDLFNNRMFTSFASQDNPATPAPSTDKVPEAPDSLQGAPDDAQPAEISEDFQFLTDLTQNKEEESAEGGVINLSALLGSVPSPDPESSERPKPLFGTDWFSERSASNPIPTLSGGLNGGPSVNNAPLSMWDHPTEGEEHAAMDNTQSSAPGDLPGLSPAREENRWVSDLPPKKKPARTAPLDPQTMPRKALPQEPALPVDYALPVNDTPLDIEEADFLKAVSGRPASMEVKTEPPVTPPGVPAVIEPLPTSSLTEQPTDPVEDTHPHLVSTITSLGQLEPSSPALSLLNYTCVLVPRLPQHYLTGELADRMAVWVQHLCLAFGWRLEGISIRPEYLQWTVQVAPAISPGNLVRIVRQRTSLQIFGHYPHLAEENPSGDFWANGYLIVSGAQPPSAQLLRDYIAQTRKRQGANK
jgi:DNA-binding NarL/FixJ family response regulator/REP element-mobilizing transposase RayT